MVNNIVLTGLSLVLSLKGAITARLSEERGQDLIEYAVLAGAIGVALFTALIVVGFPGAFEAFGTSIKQCIDMKTSTACP